MKVYFYYDTDGYFLGNGTEQKENSTEIEPTFKVDYWQKFNGKKWVNEKISNSAKDIEDVSVPDISYEDVSATNHQKELYAFFQKFLDDSHYIEKNETEKTLTFKTYSDSELLDKAKAEKLEVLTAYAGQFDQYKCDDMYVTSSIGGYKFNADIRSQTNMQGLIDVLADDATALYKDYDNEFRTMTKADLAVLKSECLQNGQYLYQQKWAYREKINSCTTKEELEAITFDFKMKDFANE